MVSIVIVSHSVNLAEGVRELANQMVQGKVSLATAGGIDDPENPIGTDAQEVYEAIRSVYSEDGVVVLMDLGSALLSAEMALEFLPVEQRNNVHLSEAPFVEGAIAAAIQASVGGTAEQVLSEARGAMAVKINQLQPLSGKEISEPLIPDAMPSGDAHELRLVVNNRLGLHARPAARFVTTANQFQTDLIVAMGRKSANAKSINQVATLGVGQGDEIIIRATGVDAQAALAAIQSLADENFGDTDQDLPDVTAPMPVAAISLSQGQLDGIPASPGIAIGPVVNFRWQLPDVVLRNIDNPEAEWSRL